MLVTLAGMVMLVKLLQPENAKLPILMTPLPRVMLVKLLQPSNALFPILVTLAGRVIEPVMPAGHWIKVVLAKLYKMPFKLL